MKKVIVLVLLAVANVLNAQVTKTSQNLQESENSYIVVDRTRQYRVDTTCISVKSSYRDYMRSTYHIIRDNKLGYFDIQIPQDISYMNFINVLEQDEKIVDIVIGSYGQYNASINDLKSSNQWYLSVINAYNAWNLNTGNSDVIVAVLDSGVDWENLDIGFGNDTYQNIHLNHNEDTWIIDNDPTTANGIDEDGNGLIDDWKGWDFDYNNNDCRPNYFHGTFVSGIISAKTNNNYGIAGIAGGYADEGVNILPYCVGKSTPKPLVLDDAIIHAVDMEQE
ncbi:MAG: S8 family serine peptidase [Bacteroidales bacterium]|nr:S8 family serine peptidase [Bacteroidales bacterium]